MKTFSLALLAATFICGACVETPTHPLPPAQHPDAQPGMVYITSEPPGATIQVNGRSLGPAPCSTELPVSLVGGRWLLEESTTIQALPAKRGEFPQTQFFPRWTEPQKDVSFQMRAKQSIPPDADAELQ